KFNFAPRFGFAWSPGAANATKPPKTVIRGGAGIFYNRFGEGNVLTADRFNGVSELQFVVAEPVSKILNSPTQADLDVPSARPIYNLLNLFPNVPNITGVVAPTQQTIWRVAPNLQAPSVYLLGVQVERQLPKNITAFVGVYNVRILHVIRQRDINAPLPQTITTLTPNGIRPNPADLCALYWQNPAAPCALGDIDQYESSGKMHQNRIFVGFNSRLNPGLSLQGSYSFSSTKSDADGGFPVNSYDFTGEWSRASFDIRHSFNLVGTINAPWWKLVFSPFITASSGPPFNITTGRDTNLDRIANERPSFAGANADCTNINIRCTQFGNFNLVPNPGEQIIPRNFGQGPGSLSVNLTVSRTFGFGGEASRSRASASPKEGDKTATVTSKRGGGGGPGGKGGPTIGVAIPGGGGAHGPGGGGEGMRGGMMGGFG